MKSLVFGPRFFVITFIALMAWASAPASAALPTDLREALQEILRPEQTAEPRRLTTIGRLLERMFSASLSIPTGRSSTLRDCAQLYLSASPAQRDPRVSTAAAKRMLVDATAREMFAETLNTNFNALAFHLDRMAPAKRAVIYYALATRYFALAPNVLQNERNATSLPNSAEVFLTCTNQFDGQTYSYEHSELFSYPPKFEDPLATIARLKDILPGTGLSADESEIAARQLASLAFTGNASKSESARDSRLSFYYLLFRKAADPMDANILDFIYRTELILNYVDLHGRE